MSERDEDLLRRYRAIDRDGPPAALDASVLAASRRAVRKSSVPRWAAPVSVAAVLVLALGLVLKVQREAPEAVMPQESHGAPAAIPPVDSLAAPPERPRAAPPVESRAAPPVDSFGAPPRVEQAAPVPEPAPKHSAPATRAKTETPKPEAKRVEAPARRGHLIEATPRADVEAAPRAADAASAPAATTAPPAQTAAAPVPSRAVQSNAARAPAATMEKSATPDPLQRELERIAHLREEGKDDEADTALATFQREHPGYRIEPAMRDRVRHR